MKKETIKTIILVLLIANCIQLTGQIWLDKKLWPSGYNFFSYVSNIPVIGGIAGLFTSDDELFQSEELFDAAALPKRIVVNGGSAREVCYYGDKLYTDVFGYTKTVMESLVSEPVQYSTVSALQWQSMLKGKSIYINFNFAVDATALGGIYSLDDVSALSHFSTARSIVISPDTVTNGINVCVLDSKSNEIVKYFMNFRGSELLKYIEGITFGKQLDHAFAFEMGLDSTMDDFSVERRFVLDSMVLFPMSISRKDAITLESAFDQNEDISFVADKIIATFGYKPSSLRRTVATDGVVTYVENNATVTVDPSGGVEYTAVTASRGMPVTKSGKLTARQAAIETINIAKNVWKFSGFPPHNEIRLHSDLSDNNSGTYTVRLVYFAGGVPVMFTADNESDDGASIYAEIEDGHLKHFRMELVSIKQGDGTMGWTSVLEAVDTLFSGNSGNGQSLKINDIFECYSVDGNKNVTPEWYIKFD